MLDAITKKQIKNYVIPFLKARNPDFVQSSQKGLFTCPNCKQISANVYPVGSGMVHCFTPGCGRLGDIFDLCRRYDFDNQNIPDEELADLLTKELGIKTNNNIQKWLEKYSSWGWSLVPCEKGTKKANVESGWQTKEHKDIKEWVEWVGAGLNIGVNGGKISNLTLIDIDTKDVPPELKKYIGTTLTQTTNKGHHLCWLYEPDLPSCNLRSKESKLPIEIRSDGGFQTVIYPSVVEGKERAWNDKEPMKMPKELKDWLLSHIGEPEPEVKQEVKSPIILESDFTFDKLNGSRNNTFLQFGGILRKYYSVKDVERIMGLVNNGFIDKPLPIKELKAMIRELSKYDLTDTNFLQKQVFDYLVKHEEASARDLVDCIKAERKDIQEVLGNLIKENKVYKQRSLYKAIQKVEWKTEFLSESKVVDYTVPYFHDYATFRRGDMICIGAGTGVGKGHLAMNIIKKYTEQGLKVNYVSSEPGNRFATIALNLGLKEGDFNFTTHYNPEKLELEDDAISIYDWILPDEFKDTAQLYKIFSQQLDRHGGLLYVFSQLNDKEEFYASAMVRFFASFAVSYHYTRVNGVVDNINTFMKTIKVRESKIGKQEITIPMKYDVDTKRIELRKV